MHQLTWKQCRSHLAAVALALGATLSLMPAQSVMAQVRGLPDFTDLVETVGPSVVNIRTLEKVKAGAAGGADEQMLEFFKRFGIPVPPNMPRAPRPDRSQPDEDQPRGVGSVVLHTNSAGPKAQRSPCCPTLQRASIQDANVMRYFRNAIASSPTCVTTVPWTASRALSP